MKRRLTTLLVLAGCGSYGGDNTVPDIAVTEAWARPTPPGADNVAIYVSISNESAPDDRLTGMASARCSSIIPHRTVIEDDIASMPGLVGDELTLPTGGAVLMEPNGLHLMCLGVGSPLEVGDEFDLELAFDVHAPIETTVSVLDR